MRQDWLKQTQSLLRNELGRASRRRSRSPWLIAGLIVAIVAISYFLREPQASSRSLAAGAQLACTVKSVYDGDTLTANCPEGKVKVRVFGINAPEMGQASWGERSRDALRGWLTDAGPIRLQVVDRDRYQRTVAQIFVGQRDVGLEMVRQGQAVVYEQYNHSSAYQQAEAEAQQARRGIWEQSGSQQNPAAWRRLNPR